MSVICAFANVARPNADKITINFLIVIEVSD